MEQLYQVWLSGENSFFEEFKSYTCDEMKVISESENLNCREEAANGKKSDKAA